MTQTIHHFSPFAKMPSNIKIKDQGAVAEVLLYGDIIESEDMVNQIRDIDAADMNVYVNSRGGDVFEGVSIASELRRHKANVTVYIDGLAASIAALIALSGDKLVMAKNTWFMIHNPWSIVIGGADDLRRSAELLDEIGDDLASTIAEKSGLSKDEVNKMMESETWLNSKRAKAAGIADEVEGDSEIEDKFDLSIFNNVPKELRGNDDALNPRRIEAAIREAGCSWSEAKAIVSGGLRSLRDEKTEPRDGPDTEAIKKYLGVFKPYK